MELLIVLVVRLIAPIYAPNVFQDIFLMVVSVFFSVWYLDAELVTLTESVHHVPMEESPVSMVLNVFNAMSQDVLNAVLTTCAVSAIQDLFFRMEPHRLANNVLPVMWPTV